VTHAFGGPVELPEPSALDMAFHAVTADDSFDVWRSFDRIFLVLGHRIASAASSAEADLRPTEKKEDDPLSFLGIKGRFPLQGHVFPRRFETPVSFRE
jgi:hypothetical protein